MAGGGQWRLLMAFAAGCLVAALAPSLPGWPAIILLLALSTAALVPARTRLVAACLFGLAWFLGHAQWQHDRLWPAERAGEVVVVSGTVVGVPESRGQSVRFMFRPDRAPGDRELPARIMVSWFRPSEYLQPGSRWSLPLRLRPPEGRDNPGGFDYQRHLLTLRAGALATVAGSPQRLEGGRPGQSVNAARQYLGEVLQAETVRLDAAALKRALGIADRSGISPGLGESLRRTGTAHLLAISGLHVGMVAGLAGLVFGWLLSPMVLLLRGLDRRRLSIAAGLLAAFGYAWLAGFTLPTQRALVMLGAVGLAFAFRRSLAPAHALLLALAAVLLFDPLSPLATGFWLSFAAVAVLIWAFAWRPGDAGRRGQWLAGLVRAQLIIAVGLLPLNVGLFQQLIPGAIAANLVAIPMVGLWILPALLAEIAGILLGMPTAWIGAVSEQGLVLLTAYLSWIDSFPWAHSAVGGGPRWALLLAVPGALWLLAPAGWPARWLGVLAMLPLLFAPRAGPGEEELELWMLDVGDGLAVVIRTSATTTLYDTGPGDGEGADLIGRTLPGMLARLGIDDPQRVVVSHAHRGYSGGLGTIERRWPAAAILSSIENVGERCLAGMHWQADGYRFEFLHPSPGLPDLGANSSCVLHVSGPGGAVLLSGGIDAGVEARLVMDFDGPAADVLVLSAGGHRRGASGDFLDGVQPHLALASVGRFDRFERPHPEVIERLDARGITWQSTGQCGALRVRLVSGKPPEIRSMATLSPRFWKSRHHCP